VTFSWSYNIKSDKKNIFFVQNYNLKMLFDTRNIQMKRSVKKYDAQLKAKLALELVSGKKH
jgi:hypothetical protein